MTPYDQTVTALATFTAEAASMVLAADNLGAQVRAAGLRDPESLGEITGLTGDCSTIQQTARAAAANFVSRHADMANAIATMPVTPATANFYRHH